MTQAAPRKEEVAQERRRRQAGTLDRTQQLKLTVPQDVIDKHPDQTFRWVNDSGNRMHALTVLDDWNKVPDVQPIPVDTDKDGKPILAHLCMKKRDFFEHDQREKLDAVKAREVALTRKPEDPTSAADPNVRVLAETNISGAFMP